MKAKKVLALVLAATMTLSLAACGKDAGSDAGADQADVAADEPSVEENETAEADEKTAPEADDSAEEAAGVPSYSEINVGTDYLDYTASIKWLTHRTDREEDGTLDALVAEFNKVYPNITVEVEVSTEFAEEALLRLSSGEYEDVMAIPAIDKAEYGTYFYPLDTFENMDKEINFAS